MGFLQIRLASRSLGLRAGSGASAVFRSAGRVDAKSTPLARYFRRDDPRLGGAARTDGSLSSSCGDLDCGYRDPSAQQGALGL